MANVQTSMDRNTIFADKQLLRCKVDLSRDRILLIRVCTWSILSAVLLLDVCLCDCALGRLLHSLVMFWRQTRATSESPWDGRYTRSHGESEEYSLVHVVEYTVLCLVLLNTLGWLCSLLVCVCTRKQPTLTTSQRNLLHWRPNICYDWLFGNGAATVTTPGTTVATPGTTVATPGTTVASPVQQTSAKCKADIDWLFNVSARPESSGHDGLSTPDRSSVYSPSCWSPLSLSSSFGSDTSLSGKVANLSFNHNSPIQTGKVDVFSSQVQREHYNEVQGVFNETAHLHSAQALHKHLAQYNTANQPAHKQALTARNMLSPMNTPNRGYTPACVQTPNDTDLSVLHRASASLTQLSHLQNGHHRKEHREESPMSPGVMLSASGIRARRGSSPRARSLTPERHVHKTLGAGHDEHEEGCASTSLLLPRAPVTLFDTTKGLAPIKHTLNHALLTRLLADFRTRAFRFLACSSAVYELDSDSLDEKEHRLRLWLSATILKRLVHRMDVLNERLADTGRADLRVGHTPLTTLLHYARTHAKQASSEQTCALVQQLRAYLQLSTEHSYLVRRIRDLASDSCLRAYKWDAGGAEPMTNGSACVRPWSSALPYDAWLVCQLLCVYLDSQLLPNAACKQSRPFTELHFLAHPNKPTALQCADGAFYIYQTESAVPHYQLVLEGGGQVIDVGAGRHNLWYTLLLFIQHTTLYSESMLGAVHLGQHALNMTNITNYN